MSFKFKDIKVFKTTKHLYNIYNNRQYYNKQIIDETIRELNRRNRLRTIKK